MNLTAICLFAICLNVSANGHAQQVSISEKDVTLEKVFKQIHKQTGYTFVYTESLLKKVKKVSITVRNASLEQVLDICFTNQPLTYTILNKIVIIKDIEISLKAENPGQTTLPSIIVIGRVTNNKGEPLQGASVLIKGTRKGTTTNNTGRFEISVPDGNTILEISSVGFQTSTLTVGKQTEINIVLEDDVTGLSDIVVVGYGTQRKADLTSSIARADISKLNQLPVAGVEQALQGRVAGVQVTSASGLPGAPVAVRIRGVGTVNFNDPLYVVDGVPVGGLNYLNPADIESIDILKDASAAAIYGNRAANGVVLITTRKGKGKTLLSFDTYYGTSSPSKNYEPAGRDEYLFMSKVVNGENSPAYQKTKEAYDKGYYTNWWKEAVNDAPTESYNLGLSGSTDKMHYSVNGSYFKQDGMISPSGYNRFTFRVNTDYKIRDWFKIGENLSISNETSPRSIKNILALLRTYDPLVPLIDLNKSPDDQNDPYNKFGASNTTYGSSPSALLARTIGESKTLRAVGNVYTDINFFKNLVFTSNLGLDISRGEDWTFTPTYNMTASDNQKVRSATASNNNNNHWVWAHTLTWTPKIGDNKFNILAGASYEYTKFRNLYAATSGQPTNNPTDWFLDAGTSAERQASGSQGTVGLNSYFGRINYSYQNKYLLSASIRHDGTSQFSPDYRWGTFPSASAGWVVSNESFWKEMNKLSWLSDLKIRGGWGQLGNQNVPGANNYATFMSGGINRRYVLGSGNIVQGYAMDNLGNSLLQWETTAQKDLAIEFGFFNNALTLTTEYYDRKTKDMIVSLPVANVFGVFSPVVNVGSVQNNGFEFTINYNKSVNDKLKYSVGGNLSTYKNKVLSLGMGAPYVDDIRGARVDGFSRTAAGRPIGEFYGWKTNGIFQSQAEVDSYVNKDNQKIQPGARPGDFRFVDVNEDGTITDNDKTTLGSPHPDFIYGLNATVNFGSFDIVVYAQGSQGNKNFNINKYTTHHPLGFDNVMKGVVYDAWTPENHSNSIPVMSVNDANSNYRTSDFYVEDGSYLRLKTMQIGYTFPSSTLKRLTITSLRVYIAAQNLFTITNYSGLDPEIGPYATDAFNAFDNSRASRLMGADYGSFPNPRTLQLGLSVKF